VGPARGFCLLSGVWRDDLRINFLELTIELLNYFPGTGGSMCPVIGFGSHQDHDIQCYLRELWGIATICTTIVLYVSQLNDKSCVVWSIDYVMCTLPSGRLQRPRQGSAVLMVVRCPRSHLGPLFSNGHQHAEAVLKPKATELLRYWSNKKQYNAHSAEASTVQFKSFVNSKFWNLN